MRPLPPNLLRSEVARFARVVAVDVAHHVTQRGNARAFVLDSDADRQVYLTLLRECVDLHHLQLLGYCLMSNHVHLIMIPQTREAMAIALKQAHGRYASYWNVGHGSCGHVWQGRYYSCPLDQPHVWTALRYTELNPVRAGLVTRAEDWPWSSAAAHSGSAEPDPVLSMDLWRRRWNGSEWRRYIAHAEAALEIAAIRRCTHSGRPLGDEEFIENLEKMTQRPLRAKKAGRPPPPEPEDQSTPVLETRQELGNVPSVPRVPAGPTQLRRCRSQWPGRENHRC